MLKELSAGGVVFKREGDRCYILAIEDRYRRITIPKGKREDGETMPQTALREIEEETGIKGEIIKPLGKVTYEYTSSRGLIHKEVTYYLVRALSGELQPQLDEINRAFWVEIKELGLLQKEKGYENNQSVLDQAFQYLGNHCD